MAAQNIAKKRKSTGEAPAASGGAATTKKAKTTTAAETAAPLKSALKKTTSTPKSAVSEKKTTKPKATTASKSKKDASPPAIEDDEESGAPLTADQTDALLAGFSSSEDEASDDESNAIPVARIPSAPSTGLVQKRIRMAIADQSNPETTPGVIYMGRLPHGFYEPQLRAYLTQFGEITHLRLARNKKTGKSQHYGFVEFASGAVADIVAKTMDKYLLFGHILQVRRVPREQVRDTMFKGSGRQGRKVAPRNKLERGMLRRGMEREGWEKRITREEQKRIEKANTLKEMGYEFDMPALKSVGGVPVKSANKITNNEETTKELPEPTAEVEEEVVTTVQSEPGKITVTEKVTKRAAATTKTKKGAKKAKK
ncbi:putative rna-binding protein [Acrodontium crateriforme]|uniref:Rna-binding protein n=1 Tax=Acrodontium crateriforme TaxID=150365 RepID=A0AAQ3R9U4_9PEZI|nr:putative rna-binding protein [Acrodontium crateriforme]